MSYWKLADDMESISFRLDSIRAIVELVAEGVPNGHHNSALWACSEMLEVYSKKLEDLSSNAMELHKAEKSVADKITKGKKK
jgi:hypothetical protein